MLGTVEVYYTAIYKKDAFMAFFFVNDEESWIWTLEEGFDYKRKWDGSITVGGADERPCNSSEAPSNPYLSAIYKRGAFMALFL